MKEFIISLLFTIINYLIGSISSAIIIAKYIKKVDIRKIGYKTAGGSNVAHNIGIKWGMIVGLFDITKGIPVLILAKLFNLDELYYIPIALSALIGHCWPLWFNFSGGRGVGTFIGIILFLNPYIAILPIIIFIFTMIPSLLKKYKNIDFKIISSPTLTLLSIIVYIFLTFKTIAVYDNILGISLFLVLLIRRVTAIIYEYKLNNPIKIFFSKLIFDNSGNNY
jgi:glycerol-3-phosphate acyltransferase PlsY